MKRLCILVISLSLLTLFSPVSVSSGSTAADYQRFILRPSQPHESLLEKYVLKHFQKRFFDGSYAIVIAVGDYQHLPKLDAVQADVEKMTRFLLETAEYDEVVVLTDADATFDIIRYFMEVYFPQKMQQGRHRFLFYFSGHGTHRDGSRGPIGYLQLQGATPKPNLASINMNHIENWADQFCHATHMLFLLDSCFSGLAGTEEKSYDIRRDPILLAQKNGRFMITAGAAKETSIASRKRWGGSLFTDVIIHAMRGEADTNHDGVVTTYELYEYTQAAVSNEARKARHQQHPLISNLGSYTDTGEYFFVYQDPTPSTTETVVVPDDKEKKPGRVNTKEEPQNALQPPNPGPTPTSTPQPRTIQLRSKPLTTRSREKVQGNLVKDEKEGYVANSFEDQGDVVVDHATGLMWQKSGSNNRMTHIQTQQYVEGLNRQKFAGYNDWRLPTIPEFMSLLEPKKQLNGLHISPVFDAAQWFCWSADMQITGESSAESAWGVEFTLGGMFWSYPGSEVFVRCVRSHEPITMPDVQKKRTAQVQQSQASPISLRNKPRTVSADDAPEVFELRTRKFSWGTGWVPQSYIDNQFEDQGDVVIDHATGLMWQKSRSDTTMIYARAQQYVEGLNRQKFAGHDDWRLPTIPELLSLLEPEELSNGQNISPVFDANQRWCWSADMREGESSSESAWFVSFNYGSVHSDHLNVKYYVWCVRSWR